ncbi:transcription initiation factor TFIID subunit 9-like [Cotesia typhae]|uniref:transcription initiation factor TFIID subunit 9-like n=1 Tax=Cotesia typhae TaxID=2053667 RepID=UPI003D68D728
MEAGKSPQMAVIIESIIKSMSIEDFDQSVVQQLLEFVYRYSTEVIEDGKVYAKHANKKFLDGSDISLALKLKSVHDAKVGPMTTSSLKELARVHNSVPLEFVKPKDGLRLPTVCYCSTAVNYKLKPEFSGQLSQTVNRSTGASLGVNEKSEIAARPVMSARRPIVQKNIPLPAFKPLIRFSRASSVHSEAKTEAPSVDMEDDRSAKRKRGNDDHNYDMNFLLN